MMDTANRSVARDILAVAQELRELVTKAPYLADRAPYAAGRVLAAAERLDSLAGATRMPSAQPARLVRKTG